MSKITEQTSYGSNVYLPLTVFNDVPDFARTELGDSTTPDRATDLSDGAIERSPHLHSCVNGFYFISQNAFLD